MIPFQIGDLTAVQNELDSLEWKKDGSGAMMANPPGSGNPFKHLPLIGQAVEFIGRERGHDVLHVMVNRLNKNTFVPTHRDWIKSSPKQGRHPCLERWHLPLMTNPDAGFWHEGGTRIFMQVGFWHGPIPYWLPHRVWNAGISVRVHLVVDLDSPERLGSYES